MNLMRYVDMIAPTSDAALSPKPRSPPTNALDAKQTGKQQPTSKAATSSESASATSAGYSSTRTDATPTASSPAAVSKVEDANLFGCVVTVDTLLKEVLAA